MKIVDYSEPHGTLAAGGANAHTRKKKTNTAFSNPTAFSPLGGANVHTRKKNKTNTAFSPMGGKMPTQEKNKHGIFAAGRAKVPTQEKKTNRWVTHIFNIYAL